MWNMLWKKNLFSAFLNWINIKNQLKSIEVVFSYDYGESLFRNQVNGCVLKSYKIPKKYMA